MKITTKQILAKLQERYKHLLEDLKIDIVCCNNKMVELGSPSKWETEYAHDTRLYRFIPMGHGQVRLVQKLVAGKKRDRIEFKSGTMSLDDLLKRHFGAEPSQQKTRPKKNYRK